MGKRNRIVLAIITDVCIVSLTGCRNDLESNLTDAETVYDETEIETELKTDNEAEIKTEIETEIKNMTETSDNTETEIDSVYTNVPQLPDTGSKIDDFVPENWEIIDSVELDYNKDGITDYVGVLETDPVDLQASPRILFAIASDKADGYRLDFQDINLIRRSDEGGVFGDPYMPLTVEGTSFTTHAYGGSAWKWSEDNTYTFRDNVWWYTSSEDTYGYMGYTTYYSKNDWESGIGIRKRRSDDFSVMEENPDSEEYDIEYEIPLDEPFTLEQSGMRWWLTPEHNTDWEVKAISFGEGVELSEDMIKLPGETYIYYCDEDCILYTFSNDDFYYIAMYSWKDKVLSVLAKEDAKVDGLKLYKGKIYYSADIEKSIIQMVPDEGIQTTEKVTVGVRLNRMELDGTGKETLFEYRYPDIKNIPYMSLTYEAGGDEIVIEVYIGGNESYIMFYRMNTDGSGLQEIGQM